ncbi:16362_t:CDS:2 [Funneliformis caledonium]|uniref:16362_t:CDS:1 n=1 Tax=Funneliformis caledonium TaxID=1117310 RepID=A0A9N9H403_9GLOM|nr:16362_t:CDS:2 [Funneliformis caledonium]
MSGVISEEKMGMLRKIQQIWKHICPSKRVTAFINVLSLIDQKREHDNHQRGTTKKRKDRPEVQDEYETDKDYIADWGEVEDHENQNDGGNDDIDKDTRAKVDKEAFRQSFEKIPETEKLKLSSGRVVEDILFNYVKDNDYEDHAHSFIINYDDQGIRELFQ